MSTVSTFLFSVGCLVGAVWELAGYALRFGWALLLPKALLAARREVRHFAVTAHPTMEWVIQQLREATPFGRQPRYLLRDNDGIFGYGVRAFLESCGIQEVRTSYESPWQKDYTSYCTSCVGFDRKSTLLVLHGQLSWGKLVEALVLVVEWTGDDEASCSPQLHGLWIDPHGGGRLLEGEHSFCSQPLIARCQPVRAPHATDMRST